MAENEQPGGNNLDDFFAKKDKSKKKAKSSKFTVDDILQAKTENEEKPKKVRSKKKEKDASRSEKLLGVKAEGVMLFFTLLPEVDTMVLILRCHLSVCATPKLICAIGCG